MRSTTLLALALLLPACGGGIVNQPIGPIDDPGETGTPNIAVDTHEILFDAVGVGASAMATIQITNTGTASLLFEDLAIDNEVFIASAGAGVSIASGSSTPINLTYLPLDYDESTGTLTITSNDPDTPVLTVSLFGHVITDVDGDGYDAHAAGGDDCDDNDADTYPGAPDEWYDGEDSNCDGADDYDQDGDGWQTEVHNDEVGHGGGDCQDANPDIHPTAADAWYDGVDSNCDDMNDYDQDGDGSGAAAYGAGTDCDDENEDIHTEALEMFNFADDDCNDLVDDEIPGWNADLHWTGSSAQSKTGTSLDLGDLDGDGVADLIIGSPGANSGRGSVAIVYGGALLADGAEIDAASRYFEGASTGGELGTWVSHIPDFLGDDSPDVALGAPGLYADSGRIYLLDQSDLLGADLDEAFLVIGGGGLYQTGRGFVTADLDGDGLDDIWGHHQNTSTSSTHRAFLLYGGVTGSIETDDTDAQYTFSGSGDHVYDAFPSAGDLNGDGHADLIYCHPLATVDSAGDGAVWVLFGSEERYSTTGAVPLQADGSRIAVGDGSQLGSACSVIPDVDGDGDDELWVYSSVDGELATFLGGASMSMVSDLTVDGAAATVLSYSSTQPEPHVIRALGDHDGDGISEVAVGHDPSGLDAGTLWVFPGDLAAGAWDAGEARIAEIVGVSDDPHFQGAYGAALPMNTGDVDGDGIPDIAVGDPQQGDASSGMTSNMGAVYITMGL
jgi:glycosylphosphatidylinositol phospholipase D